MKRDDKIKCVKSDDYGITVDKTYRVVDPDIAGYSKPVLSLINDKGLLSKHFHDSFVIVEDEISMEEQVKLAKSYIGKTVVSKKGSKFKVEEVLVIIDDNQLSKVSITVHNYYRDNKYAIIVKNDMYSNPITEVTLAPAEKIVKLNASYDAIVTKETIQVGCQTFPISILDELVEAKNKL